MSRGPKSDGPGQPGSVRPGPVRRGPVTAALLALAVVAACTTGPDAASDAGPAASTPVDTAPPYSSPAGGADTDFDVDAFDPCAPFAGPLWRRIATGDAQAAPEPGGGCRWRGPGTTATLAVESGRSLRDYSTDPAFRPGERGWVGNPYWMTATSNQSRACQAVLAVGPAQPDRVVHIVVENEAIEAPMRGGGSAHSCVFARTLLGAAATVLQPAAR